MSNKFNKLELIVKKYILDLALDITLQVPSRYEKTVKKNVVSSVRIADLIHIF